MTESIRIRAGRPVNPDMTLTYTLQGKTREIHLWFVDKIITRRPPEGPGSAGARGPRPNRIMSGAAAVLMILLIGLSLLPQAAAPGSVPAPTEIFVEADHEEADTWSSVLIIMRVPPVSYNNTSYYVNHDVALTLYDLDNQRVIYEETIGLRAGRGAFTFRILPSWGEFVMDVRVMDLETGARDSVKVTVVYSIDYILYTIGVMIEDDNKKDEDRNAKERSYHATQNVIMFLMVFITLPIALLRLDHKAARRMGRSSMVDKIVERWFNYTWVNQGLWHYLEDPRYEFSVSGRREFKRVRLEQGLLSVEDDIRSLQKVKVELQGNIGKLHKPDSGIPSTDQGKVYPNGAPAEEQKKGGPAS